jgi:hypothetical protein
VTGKAAASVDFPATKINGMTSISLCNAYAVCIIHAKLHEFRGGVSLHRLFALCFWANQWVKNNNREQTTAFQERQTNRRPCCSALLLQIFKDLGRFAFA